MLKPASPPLFWGCTDWVMYTCHTETALFCTSLGMYSPCNVILESPSSLLWVNVDHVMYTCQAETSLFSGWVLTNVHLSYWNHPLLQVSADHVTYTCHTETVLFSGQVLTMYCIPVILKLDECWPCTLPLSLNRACRHWSLPQVNTDNRVVTSMHLSYGCWCRGVPLFLVASSAAGFAVMCCCLLIGAWLLSEHTRAHTPYHMYIHSRAYIYSPTE